MTNERPAEPRPQIMLRANFYDSGNAEHPARPVVLGAEPGIFIEPVVGTGGAVTFDATVTDLAPQEAARILYALADEITEAAQRDAIDELLG